MIPRALTVAGSDSGGGAGVQADLKTFAALRVHGLSAITAITAQSTKSVREIFAVPAATVRAQIDAVVEDSGARAMKTGMLYSRAVIEEVARAIDRHALTAIVDPIIISSTGTSLLEPGALGVLERELFPRAALLTPNIPEAEALLGRKITSREDQLEAARALRARGPSAVLLKGGHTAGDALTDVLVTGDGAPQLFETRRIAVTTHGTGCTHSAAICAFLARGEPLTAAVEAAHAYVRLAIERARPVGKGRIPLHHLHPFYDWDP